MSSPDATSVHSLSRPSSTYQRRNRQPLRNGGWTPVHAGDHPRLHRPWSSVEARCRSPCGDVRSERGRNRSRSINRFSTFPPWSNLLINFHGLLHLIPTQPYGFLQVSIPQEVKAAVDSLIGALKRDTSTSSRGSVSTIIDAPSVLSALEAIKSSRALADAAAIAGGPLQLMLSTQDGTQRPATRGESELLDHAREGAIDKRFFQVVDAYAMPSVEFIPSRQAFVHTRRDRSLHAVRHLHCNLSFNALYNFV